MKCTSPVYHPLSYPGERLSGHCPGSGAAAVSRDPSERRPAPRNRHPPRVTPQAEITGAASLRSTDVGPLPNTASPPRSRPREGGVLGPCAAPPSPAPRNPSRPAFLAPAQSKAGHVPSLKAASGTGSASRVGFDTKKEVSRVCFIINKEKTTRTTSPSSIED